MGLKSHFQSPISKIPKKVNKNFLPFFHRIKFDSWIVTTYKTQDTILLIIATIFLLGLLIAFFKLNQNIEKKLKEIRDTKK